MHYQISYGIAGGDNAAYLACKLMVDGTEETAARSIGGAGVYGTSSGTWIGAVSAGSPEIKVRCRNIISIDFNGDDYKVKALTVAILG